MPRVGLVGDRSVKSLPDIISQEAFFLELGEFPVRGGGLVRPEHQGIKCLNAVIPGFSNESFEVNLHSHVVKFRGRKMYPRTLSVTYVEDMEFATTNNLRRWMEYIVGTNSAGSAGNKADYTVDARLFVYDHKNVLINTLTFDSLFPQDVPDVTVSGESSSAMQVSVTFNYDKFDSTGHQSI